MEQLAKRLAHKVSFELGYDDEKEKVVAYGMIALVQAVILTSIVAVIGLLLRVAAEALAVCFGVSLLRKYTGGAHADSIEDCTIIGVLICTLFALCSKFLIADIITDYALIALIVFTYAVSAAICVRKAPVDSPNKPIRTQEKRSRMKRYSVILLIVYLMITILLFLYRAENPMFISVAISLLLAVLWQTMTLTNAGKYVLEKMENGIGILKNEKGGKAK